MQRSVFSRSVWAFFLVWAVVSAAFSPAKGAAQSDTSAVRESESGKQKSGRLQIRIDERGISIEGAVDADTEKIDTTGTGRVEARAGRVAMREKGTDIVKFGEDVMVRDDELVRGDIVVFGGDVTVEGRVIGNVVVMAGNVNARSGSEINGDVVVLGGSIKEDPEVVIHGERVMFKDFTVSLKNLPGWFGFGRQPFKFFLVPVQFFISVILSFLIVLFLKSRVVNGQNYVSREFFKCFGVGFLTLFVGIFAVCILFILLLITLIGIPLALILLVSCIGIFVISRTVFVYALGATLSDKFKFQTENPFAIVLIGTAALYLPALIGYGISLWPLGGGIGLLFKGLGFLVSTIGYLVGLGALLLSRFGSHRIRIGAPPAEAPAAGSSS